MSEPVYMIMKWYRPATETPSDKTFWNKWISGTHKSVNHSTRRKKFYTMYEHTENNPPTAIQSMEWSNEDSTYNEIPLQSDKEHEKYVELWSKQNWKKTTELATYMCHPKPPIISWWGRC